MKNYLRTILALLATAALGLSSSSLADSHNSECNGGGNPKLTVGTHHLSLSKIKKICIKKNDVIKIKIVFKNAFPDDQKDDFGDRLHADDKPGSGIDIIDGEHSYNADKQVWRIKVDPDANVGDEGAFWIKVDDIGILDPRVKIIDVTVFNQILTDNLNQFLVDEFDLTLEQVADHYRDYPGAKSD